MFLISENEITMGALIACSILSSRALAPLAQMVALLTKFNQSMTALAALDVIINLPSERPRSKSFLHRPVLEGRIQFQDVVFSYPEQAEHAINKVNFEIAAGEKVGMLGRIGSGKSTIERLILNLYE